MPSADVNAIGRLGDGRAAWFGIGRQSSSSGAPADDADAGYVLVFGEEDGSVRADPSATRAGPSSRATAAGERGVLIALLAFFEGDAPDPPPELEMTHSEAADAVRWLAAAAERAADERLARPLRDALDAVDDGLPADVVTGHLYRALEQMQQQGDAVRASPLELLREIYARLGR